MRKQSMGILGVDYYLLDRQNKFGFSIVGDQLYFAKPKTAGFYGLIKNSGKNFRLVGIRIWRIIISSSWPL